MLFTISSGSLQEILTNVLPHTDTDKTLPILCAVQIRVQGSRVIFGATDRYTLASQSADVPTDGPMADGEVLLDRTDALALGKALKSSKTPEATVTMKSDGETITVETYGKGWTFQATVGAFPQYDRLLEGFQGRDDTNYSGPDDTTYTSFGLTASYLARFAKIAGAGKVPVLKIEPGITATKPLRVTVAGLEGYTALIMPVRLTDASV